MIRREQHALRETQVDFGLGLDLTTLSLEFDQITLLDLQSLCILTTELDIRLGNHRHRAFGVGGDGAAVVKGATDHQLVGSVQRLISGDSHQVPGNRGQDIAAPDITLLFCPVVEEFLQGYRWTIMQVEYATDIVFGSQDDLQDIYQALIRRIVVAVKADNVAKFLGRKVHGNFKDQLNTDFSTRIEGTRIKHHMAKSSIKMYDKHGLVLRIETTTNDVSFFKHYRKVEHRDGTSSMKNASVLKTIYSLGAMAGLMTAANRRYLAFISSLDQPNLGTKHLDKISGPVQHNDRSYRGFNLFSSVDLSLFLAIVRGEFTINGFRNRDLQRRLRLNGSQVTRLLKRLRLHGLTKKVVSSHKYYLTNLGRRLISCALRLREETILPTLAYGH